MVPCRSPTAPFTLAMTGRTMRTIASPCIWQDQVDMPCVMTMKPKLGWYTYLKETLVTHLVARLHIRTRNDVHIINIVVL